MFVRNSRVYYSASDLKAAVECEWALMRKLDAKLGRIEAVEDATDAMLERASLLGGEHEARALANFKATFPETVVEIETEDARADPGILRAAQERTIQALRDGNDVVFQATFFDEPEGERIGFVGFADFLVKAPVSTRDPEGRYSTTEYEYQVWDTKLARKARVTALLQLAAYADQLRKLGIPVSDDTYLLLGSGEESQHSLKDIEPVFHDRVARLKEMIEARLDDPNPIEWGAPGYTADGRCEWCAPEIEGTRDVLLVAGMRTTSRARLADAGIHTIDQLAASTGEADGIGGPALEKLRAQARMQLTPHADGEVKYEVSSAGSLSQLPPADAGDIFFDFEGDPLWTSNGLDWGLDYLWGLITLEPEEKFTAFWAHDRDEEKQALIDFLEFVQARRKAHPGLHIYHYADYERAHLLQLTARYGVGEAILDELLTEDVFVDLYPIVRRSIRISEGSYSIKKLEPLYMGDEVRVGDLVKGDESIQFYVDYTELRDEGRTAEAAAKLEEIRAYNEYDCVSTHRLRDWLLERARENGVEPVATQVAAATRENSLATAESEVRDRLYAHIDGIPALDRTPDQHAIGLAAAAIEYHRREDKSYWWEHFARHTVELDDLEDTRGVFRVHSAQVVEDWRVPEGKRTEQRVIRLRGRLAPGSRLDAGGRPFVMYEPPLPGIIQNVLPGRRGEHNRGSVLEAGLVEGLGGEIADVVLEESAGVGGEPWVSFPVALTPEAPVPTKAQREAILQWGGKVADALATRGLSAGAAGVSKPPTGDSEVGFDTPASGGHSTREGAGFPKSPALDILRRVPPRTVDDGGLEPVGIDGVPSAIVETLTRLDDSYLAVQGPPGSGKTYVGAKVIAHLVTELGWRVGVVAQSHEVIENLLRRVLSEGVPAERIGKKPPGGGYATEPGWTILDRNEDIPPFISAHHDAGFVLGGTAWDFANAGKVPRENLDLLVVDEAGQYSLANTIAVAVAAKRLLLLGDPQQLPQVTTGTHPEPIDTSALGWLSEGHDVLPAHLGYFLEETWRMHPALTSAVSDLSYEGRLRANPSTLERHLGGVEPGLHPVPIEHDGNSVESPEECAAVVALVTHHLGMPWRDPSTGRNDSIRPTDLIVVAPYNAQVDLLRRHLTAEGLAEVPVGTVDKFQGQEAAIAIVSLTASSAADVPRGISFLLQRNRLNVAISRGKWAAYLVHSPGLRDYLPFTPQGLAELSGFIRLTNPARP
ncbi:TM0106 family RecB-like putative nuclease [Pseudolysinimonas sp.]|jgi:predicted RecB family nuclease|uniref:TM0106 family RecB-like putative nuclease n=1 Tax=Pseudolysinimonas sp. TaxID=2680009 RepID=UPI00378335FA